MQQEGNPAKEMPGWADLGGPTEVGHIAQEPSITRPLHPPNSPAHPRRHNAANTTTMVSFRDFG